MSQQPTTKVTGFRAYMLNENEHIADDHRNKARELYDRHYKNEREREDQFSKEVKKKSKRRKKNGVN